MPKISWPPKQLPLTTSGNWDHWCVWQVHYPFSEQSCEETCRCVWRPQGMPVAPAASVPGCGQGKCCQHIDLFASWSNFTCSFSSSCFERTDHHHCLPLTPISMCSYCLPNPRSFCKIHFPSVVQYYLVHWLNIFLIAWRIKKSKKRGKSEGKILYHCNLICVSTKHGMQGSLRCLKFYTFTTVETYFLSPNCCETQIKNYQTSKDFFYRNVISIFAV